MTITIEGLRMDSAFQLPSKAVETNPYLLSLSLPGYHTKEIILPYPAIPSQVEAVFSANNGHLSINMPVDPSPFDQGPDPGKEEGRELHMT